MNDTARHTIPRRLDDPERWLFSTVDEAAALMGPALLGLAANRFVPGLIPEGGSATYKVVLASAPSAPVTVTPATPTRAETGVTVTPANGMFDATNWDEPQTFTVTAGTDADSDDELERIGHDVTGGDYEGAAADTVTATVKDDDQPSTEVALSVAPAGVSENAALSGSGVAVTVTGTLDRAPRGTPTVVTVSVAAGTGADGAEAADFTAVTDFTLTVPANAASGSASFTFSPVNDGVDEGDETVRVSGTTAVTDLTVAGTDLVIVEDDTRGISAEPPALSVDEGDAAGATYEVSLDTVPTGNVTVTVAPEAGTDVRAAPATLTFTPTDWGNGQTVTITAVDDDDSTVDLPAVVTHSAAGGGYGGLVGEAPVTVSVTETDLPGLTVTPPAAAVLTEGERHTYTVVLRTRPAGAVTVTPEVAADAGVAVTPSMVTVAPADWNTERIFTIEVLADDDATDPGTVSIGHAVAGPAEYASVTVAAMEVTVADDEEQSVLAAPESIEVTENGSATFTVVLGSEPVGGAVTVTPTVSGDAAVTVMPASRSFNAGNWETPKVFTVTAADDDECGERDGDRELLGGGRGLHRPLDPQGRRGDRDRRRRGLDRGPADGVARRARRGRGRDRRHGDRDAQRRDAQCGYGGEAHDIGWHGDPRGRFHDREARSVHAHHRCGRDERHADLHGHPGRRRHRRGRRDL